MALYVSRGYTSEVPSYNGHQAYGYEDVPHRVLQERSNNTTDAYGVREINNVKLATLSSSSTPRRLHGGYARRKQQAQAAQQWRDITERQWLDIEGDKLWREMYKCEGFAKYRENQRKKISTGAKKEPDVWPEHIERAFVRAIVRWPPMPRHRKIPYKGKSRGRNELITMFIYEETGDNRDRKKVMSHLQVLRPFVAHSPYVLKYFPPPAKGKAGSNIPRHAEQNMASSMFPNRSWGAFPPPRQTLRSNVSNYSPCVLEPTFFEMVVRDNQVSPPATFHTFTALSKAPRQWDIRVEDFPEYEDMLAGFRHGKEPLECEVLVADCSVTPCCRTFPDESAMVIELHFSSQHDLSAHNFHSVTRFYHGNKLCAETEPLPITYDEKLQSLSGVNFGSQFWAKRFTEVSRSLQKVEHLKAKVAEAERSGAASPGAQAQLEMTTALIDKHLSLTAKMEVYATSKSNPEEPQRVLIILWNLKRGSGTTTWKKLILPGSPVYEAPVADRDASQPGLHYPYEQDDFDDSNASLVYNTQQEHLYDNVIPVHHYRTQPHPASIDSLVGLPSEDQASSIIARHVESQQAYDDSAVDLDPQGGLRICTAPSVSFTDTATASCYLTPAASFSQPSPAYYEPVQRAEHLAQHDEGYGRAWHSLPTPVTSHHDTQSTTASGYVNVFGGEEYIHHDTASSTFEEPGYVSIANTRPGTGYESQQVSPAHTSFEEADVYHATQDPAHLPMNGLTPVEAEMHIRLQSHAEEDLHIPLQPQAQLISAAGISRILGNMEASPEQIYPGMGDGQQGARGRGISGFGLGIHEGYHTRQRRGHGARQDNEEVEWELLPRL